MATMAHLKHLLLFLWVGLTWSSVVNLNKRIYGGQNCGQSERRYHVKIIGTNGTAQTLCGGSLIHKQWVLTSAHCLKDGWDVYAILGSHPGPGQRVEVTAGSIFGDNNGGHDIMLLKLSQHSANIQPVALPTDCPKSFNNGDVVQVAGFGRYRINAQREKLPGQPTHLQCANMNVATCVVPTYSRCFSYVPYENMMCLEGHEVDICGGDSGGGVIYKNTIYGVIKGSHICACEIPAFSVKVCSYITWINEKIAQSNGK